MSMQRTGSATTQISPLKLLHITSSDTIYDDACPTSSGATSRKMHGVKVHVIISSDHSHLS